MSDSMSNMHCDSSSAPGNHQTYRPDYVYEALDSPLDIRLIWLQPGSGNDQLRGEIDYISFSDFFDCEVPQPYEALSYVWGSPTKTCTLSLPEGDIGLTSNLTQALQHIRHASQRQCIWVDAICIDQQNLQERGHQVGLMGQIYSNAIRVLVWLGPDTSCCAAETFQVIFKASYDATFARAPSVKEALERLISCKWFSRVWVVQELLLSRSATVFWGSSQIEFGHLQRPLRRFLTEPSSGYARWASLKGKPTFEILEIMTATRGLSCTDARDKIYAVLGLPYHEHTGVRGADERQLLAGYIRGMEADYTSPIDEVFYQFAQYCVEGRHTEALLTKVCHGSALKEGTTMNLPSWVPDWSAPTDTEPFPVATYETVWHDGISASLSRQLIVNGFVLSVVVSSISEELYSPSKPEPLSGLVDFWWDHVRPWNTTSYNNTFLQALKCSDASDDGKGIDKALFGPLLPLFDTDSRLKEMLYSLETCATRYYNYQADFNAPYRFWKNRKIFKCQNGTLGIGPAAMRLGDVLAHSRYISNIAILRQDGES